jgi:antitoxin MazE
MVAALRLKAGDEIDVHLLTHRRFDVARKPERVELLKRLRAYRESLPADFKFDRDQANAR